ncbi:uncharacterized protein F5147DRAFT_784317 [Suillus discolor]|uniref:Uncharacterized protein n=1 Tax=Suillus discolor TaxID=1912936 RepID=A0A9P7ERF5_9AGAM|nr:uncharacterized protein F5147DRAFT_784317 [Suillus discolor]KAG2080376.1 hypothetical protein F5147DRAFT_784317 [Suillus discolor]
MQSKRWANPSYRYASTQFIEQHRANEEIRRLNVEDDGIDYPQAIARLQSDNSPLAVELQRHWMHLQSVNTHHLWCIEWIMELPGYNGPMRPSTRKGRTEVVSLPPPHQLPQDQDDIGEGDTDEEAFRQLEDVHTYFEELDHHRVDLELV